MTRREQALLISRNQQIAEFRKRIFAGIESGEIPMEMIMDRRLPLTEQERQNSWNQMAANQWSARQAALRGESVNSSGVSTPTTSPEIFSGTPNQLRQSLAILTRSPEWQTSDEKTRTAILQKQFGTEIATRYSNSVLEREAIEKERRLDIASQFDTERTIDRDMRQAQARLAATEPEMLQRGLMNRDFIVGPEGLMERNPMYNPNDITKQNVPQYIEAGGDLERIAARHWSAVRPDRPNPIHPEKLLRIKIAEDNPNLSKDEIIEMARGQLATIMAAQKKGVSTDDIEARKRLAGYTANLPVTQAPTPVTPSSDLRFGQKLNLFGMNAARDIAGVIPRIESQFTNLGRTVEADPTFGAAQFIRDLLGDTSPVVAPEPVIPITPQQTESYRLLPDWLR